MIVLPLVACQPGTDEASRRDAATRDSAFAAVQQRGAEVMGVDQFTSTHLFTPLPTGGTIELQRDTTDSTDVATIRAHMRRVAEAFAAGDFSLPGQVHAQVVPGTAAMRDRKHALTYVVEDLPRGALVRITTADADALKAVHEFLSFQRSDHHAGMKH